jgi:hypothetical protein
MATLEQLEKALRNADAAGDVPAAKRLASEIVKMRGSAGQQQKPASSAMATVEDGARGGARGLGEGVIGMAGMFGDAVNTSEGLARGVADYFGAPEWVQDAAGQTTRLMSGPFRNAPTSQQIAQPITDATRPEGGKSFLEYEPEGMAGEVAQTGMQMLPGAAMGPGGWLPKLGGWLGATGGAETLSRLVDKDSAAAPYLKAGGAFLGGGIGAGLTDYLTMKIPPDMTRRSAALLKSVLPDEYRGQADDFATYQGLGPEARVLDAGPSTVGMAQGIAVHPSKSADDIINTLTARNDTRSTRLQSASKDAFGRGRDPELRKRTIMKAALRKAGPLYDDAIENAPALPAKMDEILSVGVEKSIAGLSEERRMGMMKLYDKLDDALNPSANGPDPQLTASRIRDLRQELDAKIVYDAQGMANLNSADRTMQSVYKDMRGKIDDILKNRLGFTEPDRIVSKANRNKEAIDFGYDLLEGGKSARSPQATRVEGRNLDPRFVKEGAAARVSNAMGTQANDLSALKNKLGGESGWNREKLSDLFGPEAVQKATKAVDVESTFAQNYADVTRGSQTARRSAAAKMVDGADAPMFSRQDTATGLALSGGAKLVNALVNRVAKNMSQTNRDALTKALLKKGPEGLELMRALAKMSSPTSTALVQALLASGGATSGARVGTGQVASPAGR